MKTPMRKPMKPPITHTKNTIKTHIKATKRHLKLLILRLLYETKHIINTIKDKFKSLYTFIISLYFSYFHKPQDNNQFTSDDYMEYLIYQNHYSLIPIITTIPVMTNEMYENLFRYLSHKVVRAFSPRATIIETNHKYDSYGRQLNNIVVQHNSKHYDLTFNYSGEWLLNHQLLKNEVIIKETNRTISNCWELVRLTNSMKGFDKMTNEERLKMEIVGIDLEQQEIEIYLLENDLLASNPYDASSRVNKRNIYLSALSILNSIANQPSSMKNYKQDDMSVYDFSVHLQARIKQLENAINSTPSDDSLPRNYFNLFM